MDKWMGGYTDAWMMDGRIHKYMDLWMINAWVDDWQRMHE